MDQIREQIHEIRNFLGPLDIKLEGIRLSFESKVSELESRISETTATIAAQAEQIRQLQKFLSISRSQEPIAGSGPAAKFPNC